MQGSIFEVLSFNRDEVHWEDYFHTLTPVHEITDEKLGTMQFKREDWFAPLGYGCLNGTKGRAGLFIAYEHFKKHGRVDIVHGTSVHSPQNFFYPALAKHFGGECITVLGATKPTTCLNHPMVEAAALLDSKFSFTKMGYNSSLQGRCKALLEERPEWLYGEYGITLDHNTHDINKVAEFAALGGYQVKNIPDNVKRLIIPFGSANSAVGILTGLALHGHKNIEKVVLVGIGPNRLKWLEERLNLIGKVLGVQEGITNWDRNYIHNPELNRVGSTADKFDWMKLKSDKKKPNFRVTHVDLHTTNWVRYDNLMEESFGGIELHPRYEGKVMRYIKQNMPELINSESLFWIVGSYPRLNALHQSPLFKDKQLKVEEVELCQNNK